MWIDELRLRFMRRQLDVGWARRRSLSLGFMTTPHPDTLIGGRPATPVDWITAGQDVQPLLDLLRTRRRT